MTERGEGHPARRLLIGASGTGLAAGLVTAAASALVSGPAALSALSAGALALVLLAVAPLTWWVSGRLEPGLALGVAVLVYGVVVLGAAVAVLALAAVDGLVGPAAATAFGCTVVAWIGGAVRASLRTRVPMYDEVPGSAR